MPKAEQAGERKALQLFHDAARRVPAYKDFLKRAGIRAEHIKTIQDFASGVPITDAKNYIAAYPVAARCWDGRLSGARLIAASSGTTGEPKFWPRSAEQEREAAAVHEWLYKMYFGIDKRSTLLLIGFPMGVYVSGVATLLPSWLMGSGVGSRAAGKYPLTIMSIGNNKAEMLRAVRHLSGEYDQTILIGHPFFIKDVIETGADEGLKWRQRNIGMMFCSGSFSEAWREYVSQRAGIRSKTPRIFSTYGSSEMLLMAYETPSTIAIKKKMELDRKYLHMLTEGDEPPQVFQYRPELRYIESRNGELIFTAASGIPLIRFNLHDRGKIIPGDNPLVALWGRSDDTLKFNAVNIYPEHIKAGLMERHLLRTLTGKFVLHKRIRKNMDEGLDINIELAPGNRVNKKMEREIQARVVKKLKEVNLEFLDMSTHLGKSAIPRVVLHPYQDSRYFKPGLKPRYIDRS